MNPDDNQSILELIQSSQPDRDRVRSLIRQGLWRDAEPDSVRSVAYLSKRLEGVVPPGAEAIVGDTIDLQAARFLPVGAGVRRAVAYVEVNTGLLSELGSGFLVSPKLFITNCHVIADLDAARGTQITFDKELGESGGFLPSTTYSLEPERFALFSLPDQLDYALVAVGRLSSGNAALSELGFCALSDRPDKHMIGMSVNIIQHPRGLPKMIALRNNNLVYRTPRTLLYETDTEQGSSGSPVFNDDWELVALHHWGQPYLEETDDRGQKIPITINVNEGVRISAIYQDLQARLAGLPADQQALLKEALDAVTSQARVTSIPGEVKKLLRPKSSSAENFSDQQGVVMANQPSDPNEVRITIPLEISVRVGNSTNLAPAASSFAIPQAPPKTLTRGSEALKIDQDYSNRTGYDAEFIAGFSLALPAVQDASLIAPLRAEEANFEAGELKYEHFSIKLNKAKRVALFTATNIDGTTYLKVDRQSGQVASEGETWFKDIRISPSYFLDQTFYSAWSTYFDRGHLTRRSDPSWGTPQAAERANADTFHFTNCSPQHFRFNQTTKYWQGVEQYVLEQGVLKTANPDQHLCVFQGPIYDDQIDLMADDVQIPSSFWKIVVWKGAKGLKAVGMVVDQLALLSEARKSLGMPQPSSSVNVSHWRVPISQIETRTGLDFGKLIRKADTIARADQPAVGEEALVRTPIRDFNDIVL